MSYSQTGEIPDVHDYCYNALKEVLELIKKGFKDEDEHSHNHSER
jgi:hypothetical protein